jgi:putative oxidoreductase
MQQKGHYQDFGLLLVRLALAAVFIAHGWQKLQDINGVVGFFGQISIPLPGVMAYVVALTEFLGGIAMLVGLWTQLAGCLLAIVMVVAIMQVRFAKGFIGGYEFELTLLLIALGIALAGPGSYSVKGRLNNRLIQ